VSKFNFERVLKNIETMKHDAPLVLANDTQKFFNSSWKNQGFDDGGLQKWKPRKKETKKSIGKSILVSSGDLRTAVGTSLKEATWDRIRFVVDVPYAAFNNDGTSKMPQRKFMGDSKTLRILQRNRLKKIVDKIWQG